MKNPNNGVELNGIREQVKITTRNVETLRDNQYACEVSLTEEVVGCANEAAAWRKRVSDPHPGRGFCLEQAERWEKSSPNADLKKTHDRVNALNKALDHLKKAGEELEGIL